MPVLPAPPARSQRDAPDADAWELCGECDAGCILTACGIPVSTEDVAAWIRATYGEAGVSGGTNAGELIAALDHFGAPAHSNFGDCRTSIDGALSRGHYSILAVYSDGRGNVNGSRHTGHWILVFGRDDADYHVMNSLGDPVFGTNGTLPLTVVESNNQGVAIEVDLPATGDEPLNTYQKQMAVWTVRIACGHAWPESQQVVDYYANQLADDGSNFEAVYGQILDDAKKAGRVPLWETPAQGGAVATSSHTHPLTGTTGAPQ